jgi:RimJ/RimL family protein N-acetyltransferase
MTSIIHTERLQLIPCTETILTQALTGNEALGNTLGVSVAPNWTEFGTAPLEYVRKLVQLDPDAVGWWTYFPILTAEQILIGSGGYKGKPDAAGQVELGYEIAPEYRNRGFAKEMTRGLIKHAFAQPEIKSILAHTLGELNPSTAVLQACGFVRIAEIQDPEEGTIWQWQLKR